MKLPRVTDNFDRNKLFASILEGGSGVIMNRDEKGEELDAAAPCHPKRWYNPR